MMSPPPGNRTLNLLMLGGIAVVLVGIVVYVLIAGVTDSPVLFIVGAVFVAAIGAFVLRKNLQKRD